MKKMVLLVVLVLFTFFAKAQRKSDIGLMGGTNFYMGDINQEKVFYKPGYHFGPLFRYNFNERTSFRLKGVYTKISGSDYDFNTVITGRMPNTFSTTFINVASQVEYNFIPYLTGDIAYKWTPYIFGGVGYSIILASSSTFGVAAKNHFVLPFGCGAKINFDRRLSGGVEWTFNKTFSDRIDGVIPRTGETSLFKNDWYNYVGLFITYKFFKFAADCPAYN
jgi:hypothetical protein